MIGSVDIKITNINTKLTYTFTLNRNITVIEGESATGKTVLFNLIRAANDDSLKGFIRIDCKYPCITFAKDEYNWRDRIKNTENSIIFFDENSKYVKSKEFAKAIQDTSNYYVIANREGLSNLAYSVNEIYKIKESGKYRNFKHVENYFEEIYSNTVDEYPEYKASKIVTEDTKSGYQFFSNAYPDLDCVSLGGNGSIKGFKLNEEPTIIVVDGAAFGAHISNLERVIKPFRKNVRVFLPESFEYILLASGIYKKHKYNIDKILDNPGDYIDSKKYFSWEQFFTDKVVQISNEYEGAKYNKGKLTKYYIENEEVRDLIKRQIPIKETKNTLTKMNIQP